MARVSCLSFEKFGWGCYAILLFLFLYLGLMRILLSAFGLDGCFENIPYDIWD